MLVLVHLLYRYADILCLLSSFRIHKYASCSNECFILALIYIDRLIQRNNFLLTDLNVHRVVITAILLAAKFFDDAYYNNAYYSKVGGVLVSEMNGLEVDFLFRINFSLHVTPELFEKYKAELISHSATAGMLIPQPPPVQLHMENENGALIANGHPQHTMDPAACAPPQQPQAVIQTAQPAAIQAPHTHHHHLAPHQVTPSPSVTTVQTVAAPLVAGPLVVPVSAVPNRIEDTSGDGQPIFVTDHLFPNGVTQQFLQRANSLPATTYSAAPPPARCSHNPPFSAPMVSMLPVDSDQYLLIDNQIFPLQTQLIHHHHGVDNFHDQSGYQHHQPSGHSGYGIGRDPIGAMVGHY